VEVFTLLWVVECFILNYKRCGLISLFAIERAKGVLEMTWALIALSNEI
jgi:hypothetical protein